MPWLTSARSTLLRPIAPSIWGLSALSGRLCEMSAVDSGAALTLVMGLVLDAQRFGETTAWVTATHSTFFPADVAAFGIDLDAMVMLRVDRQGALGRVADHLARSGAFGLVVIDLGSAHAPEPSVAMPLQSRLLGLAQKHQIAIVFLSHKPADAPSLSTLVSLRGQVERHTQQNGQLRYEVTAIKDKRRAPGWSHVEVVRGPPGFA